jgi:hypothetical protein
MNAILFGALMAVGAAGSASPAAPAQNDVRCYRLMAGLARAEDPTVRALGITAASFFLGRIDAVAPGFDVAAALPVGEAEQASLLRSCEEALNAGGFDVEALARSLAPAPDSI